METRYTSKMLRIYLIMIMSILAMLLGGCSKKDVKKQIEQMIYDIYQPSSMEQFNKSYEKNCGTLVSKSVADRLYQKDKDINELTENDLRRTASVVVKSSNRRDNSSNVDYYRVDVAVSYNLEETRNLIIYLYVNDKGHISDCDILEN